MKASLIAMGSLTQASRSLRITLLIASFTFLAGGCSTLPTTAPAPTAASAPAPAPAAPPPARRRQSQRLPRRHHLRCCRSKMRCWRRPTTCFRLLQPHWLRRRRKGWS